MTPNPSKAYVALGSNLDNPVSQIHKAFARLAQLPDSHLISQSSLYLSTPIGRLDQPDFVNAAACLETFLSPHALLQSLLAIELRHGRVRETLNAPRTLDLDILLYNDLQFHDAILTLPHPRMQNRAFVLKPLKEIEPDCKIPGAGHIDQLLLLCQTQKVEMIKS